MSTQVRVIDRLKELGLSNRQAKEALRTGKVFLGGCPTGDPIRIVSVDELVYRPNAPRVRPDTDPAVISLDENVVVAAKPSGMLSVPAPKRKETSVLETLAAKFGKLFVVHRLDEGTSGLMMFARNERSQKALKDALFVHDVERRYHAVVHGGFPEESKTVTSSLVRNRGDGLRGSQSGDGGKEAVTHLRLLEKLGRRASLVEATLETGRTHQVRIHLAEQGFPVLGDLSLIHI